MTQIKICGITNREDADCAVACGADAIGFIFHPRSPRYVAPEIAQKIIKDLPDGITKVGVFVDHEPLEVKEILAFCGLDMVQLHGGESPAYCRRFPRSQVIKAVALREEDNLKGLRAYPVAAILVDAYDPVRRGGTGERADWGLAARVKEERPLILAGGLSMANIKEAIERCSPHAVDVNSGVEIAPGRKDHTKVKEIIQLVHCLGENKATIFNKGDAPIPLKGKTMRKTGPDKKGHFGIYGGRYAAETLMPALIELEEAYLLAKKDKEFQHELARYLREYAGRETPLYYARRLTAKLGGARIYLKREDLNHTGSHKINNTLGQALLAQRMGKQRIIAETGAGQHGVATATVAALFGMDCQIFMGEEDIRRQAPNVFRMKILGAEICPVSSGTATLKDAMNEAMRQWVARVRDTFYVIGSTAGPHPYPMMVRDFQRCIGRETKTEILKREGRLPDFLIACVGGGSNAMGLFYPFKDDPGVAMIGVEAAGKGMVTGQHAASIAAGSIGVLHGNKTYLLQDENGQVRDAYSIAAGLDYPGVGPEHASFHETGRARYVTIDDQEAVQAFIALSQYEGIIPALESAHAVAYAMQIAPQLGKDKIIVINLSGRGDKDAGIIAERTGVSDQ